MVRLEGPREEHTDAQARARVPMNAAHVRHYIDQMEAGTKRKDARVRMAELAISHGNITDDGKAVWREYLAKLKGEKAL